MPTATRPEYAAIVTRIFSAAAKERREPTAEEMKLLELAFSRQGFTDGYYRGEPSAEMFGIREDKPDRNAEKLFASVRGSYAENSEMQRVGVRFACVIRKNFAAELVAEDEDGNRARVLGSVPQQAKTRPTVSAEVETQLYKTGGTFYRCDGAVCKIESGLMIPLSAINAMRREALAQLTELRGEKLQRREGEYHPGYTAINRKEAPGLIVHAAKIKQISNELLNLRPGHIYLPLTEIAADKARARQIAESGKTSVAAVMPRVIGDNEAIKVAEMLDIAYEAGIREAVCGNLGHIEFAKAKKLEPRGDYGLNIYNSQAVKEAKALGLKSATLSFELTFAQIRDISKNFDCELIVYGRLPLMVTENCIIKNRYGRCVCENNIGIVDRKSMTFPVMREFDHRNVIYNSQKLFLADKIEDYSHLGLWAVRLMLTTENPKEAVQVAERYLGRGSYEPNGYTRGLYYRGVE